MTNLVHISLVGEFLNYHCLETMFEAKLNGRFCLEFDTEEYKEHHRSLRASKWRRRRNCYMCGAGCYTVCEKCNFGKKFVHLCKGGCFVDYHSYKYFGLGRGGFSCRLRTDRKRKKDWETWSTA